jgi:carboxyl-terminal processing protease
VTSRLRVRGKWCVLAASGLLPLTLGCFATHESESEPLPRTLHGTHVAEVAKAVEFAPPHTDADSPHPLRVPSGGPPRLRCQAARSVIEEVRRRLPAQPARVAPEEFAELWADWFDPHGMWSVASDAPLADAVRARAPALLAEIEAPPSATASCETSLALALQVKTWIEELRSLFETARAEARAESALRAFALINEPVFQDEARLRPARDVASDLGRRVGVFQHSVHEVGEAEASAALDRFFPDLSVEGWAEVVLAAAVRAYVPAIDPHGEWAPLDEEWSLLSADPLDAPEPRLWAAALRTALGARVTDSPTPPLEEDDLVLSVDGVLTAGLSAEQVEQLARVDPPAGQAFRRVVVLRGGEPLPITLAVPVSSDGDVEAPTLDARRERYGGGSVLVVPATEVDDHLGDDLATLITDAKIDDPPLGVLLDLRGNGGGSTDGAAAVIGVFLPGVPSFPLIHRGVVREIMRALEPDPGARWNGPVAVLVDGYTASAAEMIAGAIDRYGRGPLLGAHTFGKGCVQEYFDDPSGEGVLRLTTLLVALPDGSALQRTGLEPEWPLVLPPVDEHEADLQSSAPGAVGPDVRLQAAIGGVRWPPHRGRVGPCADPVICRALLALGSGARSAAERGRLPGNPRVSHARRPPRARPVLGHAEHFPHGFIESRGGRGDIPR